MKFAELMKPQEAERRCTVTRRQGCPRWHRGAIGAFDAAGLSGVSLTILSSSYLDRCNCASGERERHRVLGRVVVDLDKGCDVGAHRVNLANAKRSHAGPMVCECNRGDQPALADASCSAVRRDCI
jgi:hypothetical protein